MNSLKAFAYINVSMHWGTGSLADSWRVCTIKDGQCGGHWEHLQSPTQHCLTVTNCRVANIAMLRAKSTHFVCCPTQRTLACFARQTCNTIIWFRVKVRLRNLIWRTIKLAVCDRTIFAFTTVELNWQLSRPGDCRGISCAHVLAIYLVIIKTTSKYTFNRNCFTFRLDVLQSI